MQSYKSNFIQQLNNKLTNNSFFHLTNSKEEKEYIRENNCTYKVEYGYGQIAVIKDKRTKEIIKLPIYN